MNQHDDKVALARRLETNESAAWRSMFGSPPAEVAATLGIGYAEEDGALLIWNRAAPVLLYNRLLALGMFAPSTDAALDAWLARCQSEAKRCEVQAAPMAQPGDLADRLVARGLEETGAWLMHTRSLAGALPSAVPPPPYKIERVTAATAAAWSDAILSGWQVPAWAATGVLATLVPLAEHPDWACYMALHRATGVIVGGGALFVAGGIGGLYTDGVRAEYRGRALQRALIAARLEEARRRGCDIASVQSLVASPAQRNIASMGFEVAYTRRNFIVQRPR